MPDLGPQFYKHDVPLPGTDRTRPRLDYYHRDSPPPAVGEQVEHARYSSQMNVDENDWKNPYHPLPASMERHAPGEYQPTLPGMEKMLPREATHVSVFFKHPNASDPKLGEPANNRWFEYHENNVKPRVGGVSPERLHPSQDWVHENYLHDAPDKATRNAEEGRPLVEHIPGTGMVIQDGHHRVVRDILSGVKRTRVSRWG